MNEKMTLSSLLLTTSKGNNVYDMHMSAFLLFLAQSTTGTPLVSSTYVVAYELAFPFSSYIVILPAALWAVNAKYV